MTIIILLFYLWKHNSYYSLQLLGTTISMISLTLLTTASVHAMLHSCLHGGCFERFLSQLETMHRYLITHNDNKTEKRQNIRFFSIILVIHFFLCFLFTYDLYVWHNKTISRTVVGAAYEAFRCLLSYNICVISLLVCSYASVIKADTKIINVQLSDSGELDTNIRAVKVSDEDFEGIHNRIVGIRKWHGHLIRTVDGYNEAFGWRILLLCANVFMEFLQITNTLTVYLINYENFEVDILLLIITKIVVPMVGWLVY